MNYHDWLPGESLQEIGVSKESEVRNLFFWLVVLLLQGCTVLLQGAEIYPVGHWGWQMGPLLLSCLGSWAQLVFLLGTECPIGFSDFVCRLHPGE